MGYNKNPRVVFKCYQCGNEATDRPSHYARKTKHFCSQTCYTEYKKTIPKELHPRYGLGNSLEERAKRRKTRSILNHHLRDKKLLRPTCEKCPNKAEAHHPNYEEPLNVRWLCFIHHRELHYENPELLK